MLSSRHGSHLRAAGALKDPFERYVIADAILPNNGNDGSLACRGSEEERVWHLLKSADDDGAERWPGLEDCTVLGTPRGWPFIVSGWVCLLTPKLV